MVYLKISGSYFYKSLADWRIMLIFVADPDGDALSFRWWQQNGIGQTKAEISNATSSSVKVEIPATFMNDEIHIICEVHDQSKYALPAYRRIIIKATGQF